MITQYRGPASTAASQDAMESLPMDFGLVPILDPPFSIQDFAFSPMKDAIYSHLDILNSFSECGSLDTIFDPTPMSFPEKCRFLDRVYSSYSDPDLISAKNLNHMSKNACITIEEVLVWLGDEKERRERLLANEVRLHACHEFPLSPARTTTPGPSGVSLSCELFTDPEPLKGRPTQPALAKRGRPAKRRLLSPADSWFGDRKRQKSSTKYPCPDCDNILTADRWSEHLKRVHFPEQIWECPKVNPRTRRTCCSTPFFRPDNFATHLRGEHGCGIEEISELKSACKFRTRNLFHQICGFCDENFKNREESIEHIRNHFREISERVHPPTDLGASEWKEKCNSDHKLKRGVHYRFNEEAGDAVNRDREDDDGGPGRGNSNNHTTGDSQNQRQWNQPERGTDDTGYSGEFHYYQDSGQIDYQQHRILAQDICCKPTPCLPPPDPCIVGFEGFKVSRGSLVDPSIVHQPYSTPVADTSENSVQIYPGVSELSAYPVPLQAPSDATYFSQTYPPYSRQSPHNYPFSGPPGPIPIQSPCLPRYPASSAFSQMSRSPKPIKAASQSPYLSSQDNSYPCPPPRRPSIIARHSYSAQDSFTDEESKENGRCAYPECGKIFKDLRAHLLTHQHERPEKCPIQTCDYHIKGFARKYDRMRHTLTHYKGTMVCGFCPKSGPAAEKSFNRADVFKRHLTAVHAVELTPPNSLRNPTKSTPGSLSDYAADATGKCSTCHLAFNNAQDFYEHLDECVLKIVQQEEPSEAINARRLDEVEQDLTLREKLSNDEKDLDAEADEDASEDDGNDHNISSREKTPRKDALELLHSLKG